MRFGKKIVIAVDLQEGMEEALKPLKGMDFLRASELHFVHVFHTTTFAYGLGETALIYPIEEDRNIIHQSVLAKLVQLSAGLLPAGFEGKAYQRCLFSDDPKRKFCDYANEIGADTVIVATRQERGLFESSFAAYQSKHARAHVIALKSAQERRT